MKIASLCVVALATAISTFAQPSATMRPDLLASVEFTTASSSREDLARGPQTLGSLAVRSYGVSVSGRHAWDESTQLVYGVAVQQFDLDQDGLTTLPLPASLAEFSLNLGAQRRFDPQWSAAVYLRPGFYGDFEEQLGKSFNVPALLLVNYAQSRALIWSFGVNTNPFSDHPVLPIAGVRWQFAPRWLFSVGFPRSGFTWQATESLTLRASAGFAGGSFRVSRNVGSSAAGLARIANTYVDFREVRIGLGLDYSLGQRVTLSADIGAVTDRKFDYFDRNYRLDGDAGTFVSLALKGSF
ncbi:MAG: hypothetical protein KF715_13980 [Candidatus Didemnitutus sp.]|nr:hypothetical protein [Candidatus Didemnitutus sp.]